jgi:hypothetical protein
VLSEPRGPFGANSGETDAQSKETSVASHSRTTLRRRLGILIAAAAVVTCLTAATAAATTPTRDGADARPRSLTPGFLLERGRYLTIEVPGATVETGGAGINNRGLIVGGARGGGSPDRGYLRDARGRYTTFRFPGARSTLAQKINDRGQIAGSYNNPDAVPGPQTATTPPTTRVDRLAA